MDDTTPLVNFAPTLQLLLLAALLALLPLAWVWLRSRGASARARLAALTALTLFLTFDLIVFGAFTRLSDSGLGCPDWPGCYGAATPLGAKADIRAAEQALPGGPVTWGKAWIEMIHRYLAMTVGALILVMAAATWAAARAHWRGSAKIGAAGASVPSVPSVPSGASSSLSGQGIAHSASAVHAAPAPARSTPKTAELPLSPWWPTLTLLWVIVQGLFGKYTVTLKLYPAVVTAHLLGGLLLLALLAIQHQAFAHRRVALSPALRRGGLVVMLLLVGQIALGGWVSTNYAVLACTGFPQCNGQWWPAMDFAQGFVLLRQLGYAGGGELLPFDALVAIHMAHRLGALLLVAALGWLVWALWRSADASARRFALGLGGVGLLQVLSGLSNVVLGWPLVAALGHSAGAAALVLLLTLLLARSAPARRGEVLGRPRMAAA